KLQAPEDAPAIKNLPHSQILNRRKFARKLLWRRVRLVGFLHENGVLAFAVLIARPKEELVHGNRGRLKINQRVIWDARLRFGQVKRELASEAIMAADDKHGPTLF